MDVVIVWCKECVFSQNALNGIRACLGKMAEELECQEAIPVKPQCFDLHDLHHNTIAVSVRKAKVRIIIMTHFFLDHLKTSTVKSSCQINLNRILHSKDVIAILTGIRIQEVTDNFLELLPHFTDWSVLELRSNRKPDTQFFKAFSEQVFKSYNNKTKHNETPLRPGTVVNGHAEREKSGMSSNFPTGSQNLKLSWNSDPDSHKFRIQIDQPIYSSDEIRIQIRRGELDYTGVIHVPKDLVAGEPLQIEIEASLSTQQSNLSPPEDDPIDAMIHKFPGYNKYLDEQVADRILSCFENDTSIEDLTLLNEMRRGKADYFPNLMHFAAYYGLERTVLNLLEKGNGLELCEVRNKFGDIPLDLATRRGYGSSIGQTIRDYEEVMVSWKAIEYIHNFYHKRADDQASDQNSAPGNESEVSQVKYIEAAIVTEMPAANETSTTKSDMAEGTVSTENDTVFTETDAVPSTEGSNLETETNTSHEVIKVNPISTENDILSTEIESRLEPDEFSNTGPALPVKPPRINPPTDPISDYDYPPSNPRPVEHYAIPPTAIPIRPPKYVGVLEKKYGTIPRDMDNYLPIISRGTIQRPRRLSSTSRDIQISSSEDENDELEVYPKAVPKPGMEQELNARDSTQRDSYGSPVSSPVTNPQTGPNKQLLVPRDPKDEELCQLMEQAHAKQIDLDELGGILEAWKRRSDVQQDFAERKKELERIRADYEAAQGRTTENGKFLERVTSFFRGRKKSSAPNILQISSPTLIAHHKDSNSSPPQNLDGFDWPKPNPVSYEDSLESRNSDPGLTEHKDTLENCSRRTVSYCVSGPTDHPNLSTPKSEDDSIQKEVVTGSDEDLVTVYYRESTTTDWETSLVKELESHMTQKFASHLKVDMEVKLEESESILTLDLNLASEFVNSGDPVIETSSRSSFSDHRGSGDVLKINHEYVNVGKQTESDSVSSPVLPNELDVSFGQAASNEIIVTPTDEDTTTPPPRPPKKNERSCISPNPESPGPDCPPSPKPRRSRGGVQLQYINYGNVSGTRAPPPTPEIQDGDPVAAPNYDSPNV